MYQSPPALLVLVVLVWQSGADSATRDTDERGARCSRRLRGVRRDLASVGGRIDVPQRGARAQGNRALRERVVADRHRVPASCRGRHLPLRGLSRDRHRFARVMNIPEADVHRSTFTPAGSRFRPESLRSAPTSPPVRSSTHITGIKPIGITASGYVVAKRKPGTPRRGGQDHRQPGALEFVTLRGSVVDAESRCARRSLGWQVLTLLRPLVAKLRAPSHAHTLS